MKTRALPAGDIEIGHRSTAVCHLGNIAYRTGLKILWDAKAERITNRAAKVARGGQFPEPFRIESLTIESLTIGLIAASPRWC